METELSPGSCKPKAAVPPAVSREDAPPPHGKRGRSGAASVEWTRPRPTLVAATNDVPSSRPAPLLHVVEKTMRASFERFELKYWVPEEIAREVVRFCRPYLMPDPFCRDTPGHTQRNTSLYLETADLDFVQQHVDSAPDRFKLRVRVYGSPPAGPAFFEIKRKIKSVIFKRRAAVTMDAVPALLDGTYEALPASLRAEQLRNLEAFLYLMTVYRAAPRVLVTFEREAYASLEPVEDIRVTVDRGISCQAADGPQLAGDPALSWIPIDSARQHGEPGRRVLIELKYRGVAPWWMEEMVQRLAMWRIANSKYVAAISSQLDDPFVELARTAVYG
ncbi:MAG: polyphosphate polymerase domain-containing protein [Pseudomonadota bacterium]